MEILSSSLTPVGQINFAIPIAEAMKSGSRIFIFFMDAHDMGLLIAQGYAAGLFSEGTQIIASDAGLSASVWAMMPPSEVTKMMKGVLVFSPTSGYASPQASKFLKAYLSQSNTVQDPLTGLCNDRTDDSGGINRYLFKEALDLRAPNVFTCSGTNFTSLKADGSDLDNYVSYTYDATYALARAMHIVLYLDKSPKITGEALYSALIKNVSFVGTTGLVNFSRALTLDGSRFGEGDRRTGVTYEILNFNSDYYSSDLHHALGFVKVGQWTVERGNQFTSSVSYNTADNSPPSYRLPTIFLTMVVSEVRILQSLSAILFVLCSIVTGTLIKNRSTKLVKSMQLRMQLLMLIGMYCGLTRVLIGSFRVTERNCSANEWLGHLSFWFLISPMMLKAWRVHIIVNNKTLKRVTVTEWCITKIFLFIITVVILYLTIMQVLPSATSITIISESIIDNQVYSSTECHKRNFGKRYLYLFDSDLIMIRSYVFHNLHFLLVFLRSLVTFGIQGQIS